MPEYQRNLPARDVELRLFESLREYRRAERNAVLWFAEVRDRRLYREFGYSSIWQYATERLGFSRSKTGYFVQLANAFRDLPQLMQAVKSEDLSWTKARLVAGVATKSSEREWIAAAKSKSRRDLEGVVARARQATRLARPGKVAPAGGSRSGGNGAGSQEPESIHTNRAAESASAPRSEPASEPSSCQGATPVTQFGTQTSQRAAAQPSLFPTEEPTPPVIEVPVTLSLRLSPELYARLEAGLERLQNGAGTTREELIVAAVEAAAASAEPPRPESHPRTQIFVRQCPDCGQASVVTGKGDRPLGSVTLGRLRCDARVRRPGGRNTATIPPRLRKAALERDGYRCQGAGCGRTRFLEVHHRVPRERGGPHRLENLITLCSGCHRAVHERPMTETHGGGPNGGPVLAGGAAVAPETSTARPG